jgi:hypothetical protein
MDMGDLPFRYVGSRRLDRHTRQLERLEHHVKISNEAIALFVRFWLTTTPALPDAARAAAQASGNERYRGFIEALVRQLRTRRLQSFFALFFNIALCD